MLLKIPDSELLTKEFAILNEIPLRQILSTPKDDKVPKNSLFMLNRVSTFFITYYNLNLIKFPSHYFKCFI